MKRQRDQGEAAWPWDGSNLTVSLPRERHPLVSHRGVGRSVSRGSRRRRRPQARRAFAAGTAAKAPECVVEGSTAIQARAVLQEEAPREGRRREGCALARGPRTRCALVEGRHGSSALSKTITNAVKPMKPAPAAEAVAVPLRARDAEAATQRRGDDGAVAVGHAAGAPSRGLAEGATTSRLGFRVAPRAYPPPSHHSQAQDPATTTSRLGFRV
jgi:hypothetical protein